MITAIYCEHCHQNKVDVIPDPDDPNDTSKVTFPLFGEHVVETFWCMYLDDTPAQDMQFVFCSQACRDAFVAEYSMFAMGDE